jgi:acyl-CoA thioester hydrolase
VYDPGHETERKPPFRFSVYTRVAFSDTDAQGVVYYGRYLPYFDLARTEYLRRLTALDAPGCEPVLRAQTVEYHAPARFDDLLEVFVRIPRIGRSSLTWEFAAYKPAGDEAEQLMTTATQTQVLIDRGTRVPQPIPDPFRAAVSAFEGNEL